MSLKNFKNSLPFEAKECAFDCRIWRGVSRVEEALGM